MEIALSAVTDAGRCRMAAVTAEVGAHVVLLAAQQVASSPSHVTAHSVLLSEAGDVRVLPLSAASAHEAERELRQLLAQLLALAPAAPPALKAAAERDSGGGLEALEAELHAALIPINHAAARRALARLFRETRRASGGAGASLEATPTGGVGVTAVPEARTTTPTPTSAVRAPSATELVSLDASPVELMPADLDIDVDVDDDGPSTAPALDASTSKSLDAARAADTPPPVADVLLRELGDRPAQASVIDAAERAAMDLAQGPVEHVLQEQHVLEEQHVAQRSDVRELLASFLAHTRSEERMSEELRRMLGVEQGSSRGPCLVNGVTSPEVPPRR